MENVRIKTEDHDWHGKRCDCGGCNDNGKSHVVAVIAKGGTKVNRFFGSMIDDALEGAYDWCETNNLKPYYIRNNK